MFWCGVAHERHVSHQQTIGAAFTHTAGVIRNVIHRHG
ncbi:Uncharacterised protein [Vibrio cholerae]|nr:Uncharacterised protein [Vibrio cholerae]